MPAGILKRKMRVRPKRYLGFFHQPFLIDTDDVGVQISTVQLSSPVQRNTLDTADKMYIVALIAAGSVLALISLLRIGRRDPRLPPGPPTIPILGNAHQIPLTGLGKKCVQFDPKIDNY